MKEAIPSPPIEVVCAIIRHPKDESICLAAQRARSDKMLPEKWEFPGGKIEKDESAETALVREIGEELGMEVLPVQALKPVLHQYETLSIRLIPYVCDWLSGEICAVEHATTMWCNPDQLKSLDWAAADIPIVEEWLRCSSGGNFM